MADSSVYYRWSQGSERYYQTNGRFVSRAAVRATLDATLDVQMARVRTLSAGLVAGNVTLTNWRAEMVAALKTSHLEGAAVARGGWLQLTQSDYGWVGQRIRTQLGYLQKFHDDLAYGRLPLDDAIANRASMYVESGISTNRAMEGRMAADRGEELERNIDEGDDAECDGCLDASDQGWVPIGTLPEVGTRDCLSRCRCYLAYRTGSLADEGD